MTQCYRKKMPTHYKKLLEKLNIQRCCGEFCDVTVVVQRMRFRGHRNILSAASRKLQSLIATLKPTTSRKHSRVSEELHIQEISPQGFKIVLEYIYTGSLWIPEDCLSDVSVAAAYLDMEDIVPCCLSFALPNNGSGGFNMCSSEKENEVMSPSSVSGESDSQFGDEENSSGNNGVENSDNSGLNTQLISTKLPVLDSSLGGLLSNTNTTSSGNQDGDLSNTHSSSNNAAAVADSKPATLTTYNLNGCNTQDESASMGRCADSQNGRGAPTSTYPDQDALSEISVQNEDDMMYQVASSNSQPAPISRNGTSQSESDYNAYHHYVPPIEQTFSPRPMTTKMIAAHMTVLPSMLSSQAFFQEQGQFPLDTTYYVSQAPANAQFYSASNYTTQQDQNGSARDYMSVVEQSNDQNLPQSAQNYSTNQGYSSLAETDRQRMDTYHSVTNGLPQSSSNLGYQHSQTVSNYNSSLDYDGSNNHVYGDITDLSTNELQQHIHGSYSNRNMSEKSNLQQVPATDIKIYPSGSKYSEVGIKGSTVSNNKQTTSLTSLALNYVCHGKGELASNKLPVASQSYVGQKNDSNDNRLTVSANHNYISISPVSCQESKQNDQPFIEAISPYNPETDISVSTHEDQMPSLVKETTSSFVNHDASSSFSVPITSQMFNNKSQTHEQQSVKTEKELQNIVTSKNSLPVNTTSNLNSTSHFSNRPAARMPPKKAGYRGIESDYNRNFNIFVDQYSTTDENSVNKPINNSTFKKNGSTVSTYSSISRNSDAVNMNTLIPQQDSDLQSFTRSNSNENTSKVQVPASDKASVTDKSKCLSEISNIGKIEIAPVSNRSETNSQNLSGDVNSRMNTQTYNTNIPPPITIVQNYSDYNVPIQTKNSSDNVHIQTKKMAASQAAKAAIQANNAATGQVQNRSSSSNPQSVSQNNSNTSNSVYSTNTCLVTTLQNSKNGQDHLNQTAIGNGCIKSHADQIQAEGKRLNSKEEVAIAVLHKNGILSNAVNSTQQVNKNKPMVRSTPNTTQSQKSNSTSNYSQSQTQGNHTLSSSNAFVQNNSSTKQDNSNGCFSQRNQQHTFLSPMQMGLHTEVKSTTSATCSLLPANSGINQDSPTNLTKCTGPQDLSNTHGSVNVESNYQSNQNTESSVQNSSSSQPLEHSGIYGNSSSENGQQVSDTNVKNISGGLTPTKSNMADLVDSYIEDYLRYIDHNNEHPSPTKSSNFQQINIVPVASGSGTSSNSASNNVVPANCLTYNNSNAINLQITPGNASYNNTDQQQEMEIAEENMEHSDGLSNHFTASNNVSNQIQPNNQFQSSSTSNSSSSASNGINSVSYSVEDVRKTILNVLSQECFDEDSGLGTVAVVKEIKSDERYAHRRRLSQENVPLTTLLKMVPFDKTKHMDAVGCGSSGNTSIGVASCSGINGNLTQYADISSSQENTGKFSLGSNTATTSMAAASNPNEDEDDDIVRHFEDIDSASDDDSDYNLVIDFDKEIHEDDDHENSSLIPHGSGKMSGLSKSASGKGYKGKLSAKLKSLGMLDSINKRTSVADAAETCTARNSLDIAKLENTDNDEDYFRNFEGEKGIGDNGGNKDDVGRKVGLKRKRPPIRIPKYSLTTEYREDSEARLLGHRSVRSFRSKHHRAKDEQKLVKPLKKRIKLKLLMKKLQDEDVTVTRHMLKKKVPNRRIKYVCELCQREFYDSYKLFATHMKDHSQNELNLCNICGMGYRRIEDLSKHRSSNHSLHSFQCKNCSVTYDNAVMYKRHCVEEHKNPRPFYCVYLDCKYTSDRFNTLEKHTLIHSEEKQFTCPHCCCQFSQPNGLRAHLVSCMNMQTYICHLCGKTFNRNQGLKNHLLCHSGVKSNVCKDCGACFNDVRNYKRHCRTHSNELKFACKHCDCKFNYSHVLKRHIVKKHPDKESVEFGKKGAKNKESVLIKNYI